ncbi:MAG: hypothetical protein ACOVQN_02850 [Exiguobacterium sp.]
MSYILVKRQHDETSGEQAYKRHCSRASMQRPLDVITQDEFNQIISKGTVAEIASIIKYKEMVIGFDSQGYSPLMRAADRHSDVETVVTMLIDAGAKMHSGCFFSMTPLCYAATKSPGVLKVFIEKERNWDFYKDFPIKPWQFALYTSSLNFLAILPYIPNEEITAKDEFGRTLLMEIVTHCSVMMRCILDDRRFSSMVEATDNCGFTALAYSLLLTTTRVDAVVALRAYGANLLFKNGDRCIYFINNKRQRSSPTKLPYMLEYARNRLRNTKDHSEFDRQYLLWYK